MKCTLVQTPQDSTWPATRNVNFLTANSSWSSPPHAECSKLTLPAELWLSIAQHLRYKELVKLLGLNRIFFGLVMDRRYRTLNLVEGPERFIHKLESLVHSPYIASRVRILILGPQDTWEAINYWPRPKLNEVDSNKSLFPFKLIKVGFTKISSSQTRNHAIPSIKWTFERRQLVINAARMLNNLTELRVVWRATKRCNGDSMDRPHPSCLFLETLLHSFGRNLRSLSLAVPSSVASVFVPPAKTFENLEDLNIVYHADELRSVYSHKIHMVSLLPLINGTSHTLKSFSIEAYGRPLGDLSTFFTAMKSFPVLSKLSIVMPLGPALIRDASGLTRLLKHPLQDLTVRFQYGTATVPSILEMAEWYSQCIQGVSFGTIQRLALGHSSHMSHDLHRHTGTLRPPCEHLISLNISDIHLSHLQVMEIVTIFNGRLLQNLSLRVKDLCLQLIDVLSVCCPKLVSLCLVFDVIRDFPMGHLQDQASFAHMISNQQRRNLWRLTDIDVCKMNFNHQTLEEQPSRQWDVMRSLAKYVPAIESFAGRGYMDEDD